jgi:hypothetical protein
LNFYAYVGNNPTNGLDPLGLLWSSIKSAFNSVKDVVIGAINQLVNFDFCLECFLQRLADCFSQSSGEGENEGLNRFFGGLRMLGGLAQMVAGSIALLAPEPTMLTKVVGTVAVVHGADDFMTGFRQLLTGNQERSVTEGIVTGVACLAGASDSTARYLGQITDMLLGFVTPIGAGSATLRVPQLVTTELALAEGGRMIVPTLALVEVGRITQVQAASASMITHAMMMSSGEKSGGDSDSSSSSDEENQSNKRSSSQDKLLSKGEIKKLQKNDYDVHELKGGKNASRFDLYKDKEGNIYIKPKGGIGDGDPTGININDL